MKLHDAAVDKADHHDGGGAGALDDGRNNQAQCEAFEGVVGKTAQDFLKLAARLLFKRFAHGVHAEQKQGQAAKQREYIKYAHDSSSFLFLQKICFPFSIV